MSVRVTGEGAIELSGHCTLDDAEPLREHLSAAPRSPVEWGRCEYLHCAVLQVLIAARPQMRGTPRSEFLNVHIRPLIEPMPEKTS